MRTIRFFQPTVSSTQSIVYSDETAKKIDESVRELMDQALEHSIKILKANRSLLDNAAVELLKSETLNQPEIEKLKQAIVKINAS